MANYVSNELQVTAPDKKTYQDIRTLLKGEDSAVDFNKVVPMPPELDIECGSVGSKGFKVVKHLMESAPAGTLAKLENLFDEEQDLTSEEWNLGIAYYNNLIKYGYTTWYDWRNEYWGTKWNAMSADVYGDNYAFETAWDTPTQVIVALSKMFPDAKFEVEFYDEDLGYNCGSYTCKNGRVVSEWCPDYVDAIEWLHEIDVISDEELEFFTDNLPKSH